MVVIMFFRELCFSFHRSGSAHRSGFTVLELLAVLALTTLLIGGMVPALRGLHGAESLSGGGVKAVTLFEGARQNAISKGIPTAVVILKDGAGDLAYRTLAVFELLPGANGGGDQWNQIFAWQTLPPGVVIDKGTEVSNYLGSNLSILPALPTLEFQGKNYSPDGGFACQIFLPSGRLKSPPAPCNLTLVRGYYADGELKKMDNDGANYYSLFFVDATGEAKITRP
jgi:hypothetical protein